jgi:predicted nuclease of restriction endonuclease-like RecB superfamily
MLTAAHRLYRWDRRTSSISSDRLEATALPVLEKAILVYRRRVGDSLGQVRNAARAALDGLRPDRVEPVVALLDDVATYEWPPASRQAERRLRIFEAAAARHPLLDAEAARAVLDGEFEPAPAGYAEAVPLLYADYPEFHRLRAFPPRYTAADLRDDYDLAQAQALLYAATAVTVETRGDLKFIVQHARLARLLHRVERMRGGYRFHFDGPNSILRSTRAYGVDFARFLAALVQARDWRLEAQIRLRKDRPPLAFRLSSNDGLRSRIRAPRLFDSTLEEAFGRKFGAERDGWRMDREAAVLESRGQILVPDFLFTHEDGTEVALEIVGYWTPEYLAEKFAKLAGVRGANLLVAVPERLALTAGTPPAGVLSFKSRLLLRDLLPRLEAFRAARVSVPDRRRP